MEKWKWQFCIACMNKQPAPNAILEFVSCPCKKNGCKSGSLTCKSLQLACTNMCDCTSCENSNTDSTDGEDGDFSDNDSGMDS